MKKPDDIPVLSFENQQRWEAWLEARYADTKGVWLKIAKKDTNIPSVSYSDALDCALCYGWIDGQKAAYDEQYWLQKFTPRGAKSIWSKVNCDRVEALIVANRMQPAGMQQIERAKADGRWDAAYEAQSKITVPPDLQRELDNNQKAQDFFNMLDSANRYAILFRIHTAKKPETRATRIQKFVEMLENGQKIHP